MLAGSHTLYFLVLFADMASSGESSSLLHIRKLEGAKNYDIWRTQVYNVLLQKSQHLPIREKGVKPSAISDEQWLNIDELMCSTLMLSVVDSLLPGIRDMPNAWAMWQRLENTYSQKSATGKVYWLKKLTSLEMKEGTSVSAHINEFKSIFSQVLAQGLKLDEEVQAVILLGSLPESWDTFRTATSNSNPLLNVADVEGAILPAGRYESKEQLKWERECIASTWPNQE